MTHQQQNISKIAGYIENDEHIISLSMKFTDSPTTTTSNDSFIQENKKSLHVRVGEVWLQSECHSGPKGAAAGGGPSTTFLQLVLKEDLSRAFPRLPQD